MTDLRLVSLPSIKRQRPADRAFERAQRRVLSWLRSEGIHFHNGWLVAVSGGPDSLALWRLALALGRTEGFRVEAAHIDHGLRSTAADEAQQLRSLAAALGVCCHVVSVRVKEQGEGPEAAARMVRHRALEVLREARGLSYVAFGHSADDQAETVLMRALAGSGLRGLASMRPLRDHVLRPVLSERRTELDALARAWVREPVADQSNSDPRYLRSNVRHGLMADIVRAHGDVVPHFCALAEEALAADALAVDALQGPGLEPELLSNGQLVGVRSELNKLSPWLRGRWLILAMEKLERAPRKARDSLHRFSALLPGIKPFELHFSSVVVEVGQVEVKVSLKKSNARSSSTPKA